MTQPISSSNIKILGAGPWGMLLGPQPNQAQQSQAQPTSFFLPPSSGGGNGGCMSCGQPGGGQPGTGANMQAMLQQMVQLIQTVLLPLLMQLLGQAGQATGGNANTGSGSGSGSGTGTGTGTGTGAGQANNLPAWLQQLLQQLLASMQNNGSGSGSGSGTGSGSGSGTGSTGGTGGTGTTNTGSRDNVQATLKDLILEGKTNSLTFSQVDLRPEEIAAVLDSNALKSYTAEQRARAIDVLANAGIWDSKGQETDVKKFIDKHFSGDPNAVETKFAKDLATAMKGAWAVGADGNSDYDSSKFQAYQKEARAIEDYLDKLGVSNKDKERPTDPTDPDPQDPEDPIDIGKDLSNEYGYKAMDAFLKLARNVQGMTDFRYSDKTDKDSILRNAIASSVRFFKEYDTNKDGSLDLAEVKAFYGSGVTDEYAKTRFDLVDANDDGKVSVFEDAAYTVLNDHPIGPVADVLKAQGLLSSTTPVTKESLNAFAKALETIPTQLDGNATAYERYILDQVLIPNLPLATTQGQVNVSKDVSDWYANQPK